MRAIGSFAILVWLFLIIGGIANIWQSAMMWMNLEFVTEASGFLVVKTITIFIPFVGSMMGFIGFF